MTSPYPRLGRLGRYELIARLARGGMAEVYLARATGAGGFARQLVIKRILPHLVEDPEFIAMFLDEARIAARLDHPNVCQVHELGEADGSLFLAMEYLDGLSWAELAPRLPRDGAFELACAASVLDQICRALRYAHELRAPDGTPTPVVHRDVSPQNLMVTRDGVCKLLDFGVSKVLTEGSRTRTGVLKGKLAYMAPEQIRGESVDPRADVFSLGVVLWEALTGERLFRRDTDYQIWRAVTEEAIPAVTTRAPRLPAAVDGVVSRALERDRDRRYGSVAELAAALRALVDSIGGPLDQPALAEIVRSLGAAQLAERAQLVRDAQLADAPMRRVASAAGGPAVAPVRRLTSRALSATKSLRLRSGLVAIGGHARRRWRGWAAAAVLAAGAAAGFAAVRAEVTARVPVASASEPATPPAPETGALLVAAAVLPSSGALPSSAGALPSSAASPPASVSASPPVASVPPATHHERGVHRVERPGTAAIDNGARSRPRSARTAGSAPSARAAAPGQYSVDSRPYATIFIDGTSYGETPLFKVSVAPGRHQVRAVRSDGQVQHRTVTIESGKLTSSGTLAW